MRKSLSRFPISRRDFLKTAGTLTAAELVLSSIPVDVLAQATMIHRARATGLNVLQGITTETHTQLTVDLPKTLLAQYTLTDIETGKVFEPQWVKTATNVKSEFKVEKIAFSDLELGHRYKFLVKDKEKNSILEERFLSTVDLQNINAKIAVMSCMKFSQSARVEMWPSAQAADADYYFFIGDTVYGDSIFSNGPDKLWSRFIETRNNIGYYQWKNLKPVLAIWDDHDYGKNDSNGEYKHKKETLAVFKSFFGHEPVENVLTPGPGNSLFFRAFHQNFIFLDCRYFRQLKYDRITGFLGKEQIAWVEEMMAKADGPTWIMEGSPFFGRREKGSAASYQLAAKEELKLFIANVSKWNSPSVFMGGDVHFSEISRIPREWVGYQTYEFISSCMHSGTKSAFYDNPHQQLQGCLKENFLLFEKTGLTQDASWGVKCIGAKSQMKFQGIYDVG